MARVSLFATPADFAAATAPWAVWADAEVPADSGDAGKVLPLEWRKTDGAPAGLDAGGGGFAVLQPPPAGATGILITLEVDGVRRAVAVLAFAMAKAAAPVRLAAGPIAIDCVRPDPADGSRFLYMFQVGAAWAGQRGARLVAGPIGLYVAPEVS